MENKELNIYDLIRELTEYGMSNALVDEDDEI